MQAKKNNSPKKVQAKKGKAVDSKNISQKTAKSPQKNIKEKSAP